MQEMMEFNTWFLQEMPAFLLSDPVKYFFGLILLSYSLKLILSLRKGV